MELHSMLARNRFQWTMSINESDKEERQKLPTVGGTC